MNKSVFSRRVFLKGSAVAVTALTLSACGGGNETVHYTTHPETLSLGRLKLSSLPFTSKTIASMLNFVLELQTTAIHLLL